MFLILWGLMILASLIVVRFAVKKDLNKNSGHAMLMIDLDEVPFALLSILVILIPFINIIASIVFYFYVLCNISNSDGREIIRKVLFIRKNKKDEEDRWY